jgi:putative transposase
VCRPTKQPTKYPESNWLPTKAGENYNLTFRFCGPTTEMRNILEHVRRRDFPAVKNSAQAIYLAADRAAAVRAFRAFQVRWGELYPAMVRKLEQDLPDLLSFFQVPQHLWRKLRTTNVIERCFVEVRRRTRPMVCFVNELSVERIIYAIFHRFNEQWKNRTLRPFYTSSLTSPLLTLAVAPVPGSL